MKTEKQIFKKYRMKTEKQIFKKYRMKTEKQIIRETLQRLKVRGLLNEDTIKKLEETPFLNVDDIKDNVEIISAARVEIRNAEDNIKKLTKEFEDNLLKQKNKISSKKFEVGEELITTLKQKLWGFVIGDINIFYNTK